MRLIPANLSHAQDMHRIHTKAVTTSCKDFYTPEQITAWLKGRSPEGYHEGIEKGEMFVAEDNGKIVGFGHAIQGEVLAVFVYPDCQKQGIGTSIFNHALEIASQDNPASIRIESTVNASDFYEHHGFEKTQESTFTRNGVEMPMVILEKKRTCGTF